MAEEFVIKLLSGASEVNSTTGSNTGSAGGTVSSLSKIGGAIFGIKQLLDVAMPAINSLISPIKGMFQGLFRMIGELLRPITNLVTMLLRPILLLIRPIVQLFKTYMAPFMDIARGFSQISSQQMSSGNIAGAMQTSMEAIKTVLGPFIVSITSVGLQLATSMIVGSMTSIVNLVLEGVKQILSFIPLVGDGAVTAITNLQNDVKTGGQSIVEEVNGFLNTQTINVLKEMESSATKKLETFKKNMNLDLNTGLVETPDSALKDMKNNMKDGFDENEEGSIPKSFNTGLGKLKSSSSEFATDMNAVGEQMLRYREEASNILSDLRDKAKEASNIEFNIGLINIDKD